MQCCWLIYKHFCLQWRISTEYNNWKWRKKQPGGTKQSHSWAVLGEQRNISKKKQACFGGSAHAPLNATPPIGKIHPFSKMAVTFKPMIAIFYVFKIKNVQYSLFHYGNHRLQPFVSDGATTFHIWVKRTRMDTMQKSVTFFKHWGLNTPI